MDRRKRKQLLRNGVAASACAVSVLLAAGVPEAANAYGDVPLAGAVALMPEGESISGLALEMPDGDASHLADASRDWDADESYLLAKIAMAEAEGEDTVGKALVVMTVLNRVLSDCFPGTIEEVIMEEHGGTYQFSVVRTGGRWWRVEPDADCYAAVDMVARGWDESLGALYFESNGGSAWHQRNLEFLFRHGNHNFYREKEGMQ